MTGSDAPESDPPTISHALRQGIVTIEIGAERKQYCVHKALLVHHSEYFKKALQGDWKEAREGKVTLEDVEPAAFNIFVHWLYFQSIPEQQDYPEWERIMEVDGTSHAEDIETQLQAYMFADRFLVSAFRRTMNEAVVESVTRVSMLSDHADFFGLIEWAFEHVPAVWPILQLIVSTFCNGWEDEFCDEEAVQGLKALPTSFVARVIRRYSQLRQDPNGQVEMSDCCFLEHTGDKLKACVKVHMQYDAETDYGFFRKG